MTDVADTEQLLRIIQSIPSPKAEPFKLWLAQVGRERIEETIDPELTIDKVAQRFGAPDKFAVRKLGTTLGRDGWRHEPQPSSRTDEYMAAHRFDTFEEAHAAIRAWREQGDE